VLLYWSIGHEILRQQRASGWGDDVVGRIAQDLALETNSARGFSRRNLFYMRRFAALWPERETVHTDCTSWLVASPGAAGAETQGGIAACCPGLQLICP
jgi:hypothetical protein